MSLPDFLKVNFPVFETLHIPPPELWHPPTTDTSFLTSVLIDLDNDGKRELIIWSHNKCVGGGICDQLYFFKRKKPDKYQYLAHTFPGYTCSNKETSEFIYDLDAQFDWFFAYYVPIYQDSSETRTIPVHAITLKYNKGKLNVVQGNEELKNTIYGNLDKFSRKKYQEPEKKFYKDNGLRKEFAMNLTVFYYSFGRDISETKRLFDKYYKFPDAEKVWSAFVQTLETIRGKNDF